jgi:carboxyl-terminal processing protease
MLAALAGLLMGLLLLGALALNAPGQILPSGPRLPISDSLSPVEPGDAQFKVLAEALALIEGQYVESKPTKDLVYGAIKGAMGTLDPHSSFMSPDEFKELQIETKGRFTGIGIEITLKDRILTVVSPIEGTPGFRAGLQSGDQIVKINGKSTKNTSLTEAVSMIRGPKGTQVVLTINREGFAQPRDFSITRETIPIRSVKARILPDGIGYVRLVNFQDQTDNDMRSYLASMERKLTPMKGLIIDLRNNSGGLLEQAVRVTDEFLASGLIVYTEGRSARQNMKFYAQPGKSGPKTRIPIVVLINEGSASASEIVAGALKDLKRAVIVGAKSFGKGSVQTIIPLEDGSALRLTTALYYTPSGITIQDKGIIPDVVVAGTEVPEGKSVAKLREEALDKKMKRQGLTDKPWSQPITAEELAADPQLAKAAEILRNWPPKKMAQPAAPPPSK